MKVGYIEAGGDMVSCDNSLVSDDKCLIFSIISLFLSLGVHTKC